MLSRSRAPGAIEELLDTLDALARGGRSADDRGRVAGRGGRLGGALRRRGRSRTAIGWWSDNGRARERKVTVGSGTIPIKAPRVNRQARGVRRPASGRNCSSRILPASRITSPKVGEVIPILYLRPACAGPATCRPALEQLLGEDASGLAAATIAQQLYAEELERASRRLSERHLGLSRLRVPVSWTISI